MSLFRKILVPTDFSAYSREAVRIAASLARLCSASLTLITVYDTMVVPTVLEGEAMPRPQVGAALYEQTVDELSRAVRDAIAGGAVDIDPVLAAGSPPMEILARARRDQCDLIVMGTHGRTGIKHALLGSVAERVVRKATCAVLTVHAPTHRIATA